MARKATEEDLEGLAALFVACFSAPPWNEPWTLEAARRRLHPMISARGGRAVVAVDRAEPIGLALGQVEAWFSGNHFLVQEFCVLPSRQREGIGEKLLQTLFTQVAEQDAVSAVYLLTERESSAEMFYAKRGFRRSEGKVVLTGAVAGIAKPSA